MYIWITPELIDFIFSQPENFGPLNPLLQSGGYLIDRLPLLQSGYATISTIVYLLRIYTHLTSNTDVQPYQQFVSLNSTINQFIPSIQAELILESEIVKNAHDKWLLL